MKKLYCITCSNYRKFEKPNISHLLEKLSKEDESTEILKILGLIENI